MSTDLFVSIVVPVYNVEKHIKRALNSLQNQTFKNFEVIIVDDFGQDNSIKIAEEYSKKDSRFKIVYHDKNLGTYHARKTGVDKSSGKYILFLDPDDELNSKSIEKILLEFNDNVDLVLFNIKKIPNEKFYQTKPSVPKIAGNLGENTFKKILNHKGFSYGTAGKAYKREVLLESYSQINLPLNKRLVFGEDILLFAVCFSNTLKVSFINEQLYFYHIEKSSITKVNNKQLLEQNLSQLEYIIGKLTELSHREPYANHSIFIKQLRYASLNISIRLEQKFKSNLKNYITLLKLKPTIKVFARFILFLLTFGGYIYKS